MSHTPRVRGRTAHPRVSLPCCYSKGASVHTHACSDSFFPVPFLWLVSALWLGLRSQVGGPSLSFVCTKSRSFPWPPLFPHLHHTPLCVLTYWSCKDRFQGGLRSRPVSIFLTKIFFPPPLVYERRVTSIVLVFSLSSHRHSYTSYL
jgi:hypothetical protein